MERFIRSYCATVMQIMEERSRWELHIGVQAGFIALFFMQIGSYIISKQQSKPIIDDAHIFLADALEVSTGTHLLYMKKNNTLTFIVFGIITAIIYSCYIYVGVITYLRAKQKEFLHEYKNLIYHANSFLHTFLTYYFWIFQIPFIEINLQFLACNSSSFITTYQTEEGCKQKNIVLIILGSIGAGLSIIIGFIVLIFLRSYSFNDPNPLKRNFTFFQFASLLFQIIIMFLKYLSTKVIVNHIFGIICGTLLLIDLFFTQPLKNPILSTTYTICACFYTITVGILTLWLDSSFMIGFEVLRTSLLISALLYFGIRSRQNVQKSNVFKLTSKIASLREDGGKSLQLMVEQLENMEALLTNDEKDKFQLIQMINWHKAECIIPTCCCRREEFLQDGNVNGKQVLALIEEILWRGLGFAVRDLGRGKEEGRRASNFGSSRHRVEGAVMKYITFLSRIMRKPTKAYFELKKYIAQEKSMSFYFQLISIILSERIEDSIAYAQKVHSTSSASALNDAEKEDLNTSDVIQSDIQKRDFLPKIANFFASKSQFWLNMITQPVSMDHLQKLAQGLSEEAKLLQIFVKKHFMHQSEKLTTHTDIIQAKLLSVYLSGVSAQYLHAYSYQNLVWEQLFRDFSRPLVNLNGYSILKGDLQCMRISMVKFPGKIVSTKHNRLAGFFGYTLSDFQRVQNIHELMPPYFAAMHDLFINNMAQRGFSPYLSKKLSTFFLDSKGFLQQTNIYMTNMHGFVDDYCMQAAFLKLHPRSQFILFEGTGIVKGISRKFFRLLFKTRDQHEDNFTSFNHRTELGNNHTEILNVKQFCDKVNLYLIVPSLLKYVKKHFSSEIRQLPVLDPAYVNSEKQICFMEAASVFVPKRLLSLNETLKSTINEQQVNSMFVQPSKQLIIQKKTPEGPKNPPVGAENEQTFPLDLKDFFQKHKNEWKDDSLYSQLKIKFNLIKKTYWYVQSDGKMANKSLFVLEIAESIDITIKNGNLSNSKQIEFQFSQIEDISGANQQSTSNKIRDLKGTREEFPSLLSVTNVNLSPQTKISSNERPNSSSNSPGKHKPDLNFTGQLSPGKNKPNLSINIIDFEQPHDSLLKVVAMNVETLKNTQNNGNKTVQDEKNGNINVPNIAFDPTSEEKEDNLLSPDKKFQYENQQNFMPSVSSLDNNNESERDGGEGGTSQNNKSDRLSPSDRTDRSQDMHNNRNEKINFSFLDTHDHAKKTRYSHNSIKLLDKARIQAQFTERDHLQSEIATLNSIEDRLHMVSTQIPIQLTSGEQLVSENIIDKGLASTKTTIPSGNFKSAFKDRILKHKTKIITSNQEIDLLDQELDEKVHVNQEPEEDTQIQRSKSKKWTRLLSNKKQIEKLNSGVEHNHHHHNNHHNHKNINDIKTFKKKMTLNNESENGTMRKKEAIQRKEKQRQREDINNNNSQTQSQYGGKLNTLSQQIVQELIFKPKMFYQDVILIVFVILLGFFIGASVYFVQVTQEQLQGLKTEIAKSYTISYQQTVASNLTMIADNLFIMFDGAIFSPLVTYSLIGQQFQACFEQGQAFQGALSDAMPIVFTTIENNPLSLTIVLFSAKIPTTEILNTQQALWETGAQAFGACTFNTQTKQFGVGIDQITFLIANFLQLEVAAAELTNRMLNRALGRDSLWMDGVSISLFLVLGAGSSSILIILYILRRHRQFKERVLLLVTRISKQEAEKEIVKFKQCSIMMQDPNEYWAEVDFVSYITTDFVMEESTHATSIGKSNNNNYWSFRQQKDFEINVTPDVTNIYQGNQKSKSSQINLKNSKIRSGEQQFNVKTTTDLAKINEENSLEIVVNKQKQQKYKKMISEKALKQTHVMNQKQQQQNQSSASSRLVSSQLKTRNLSWFKEVSMFTGLILVCCFALCIAAIIAKAQSAKFDTAVNFYIDTMKTLSAYRTFVLLTTSILTNWHFIALFNQGQDNLAYNAFVLAYAQANVILGQFSNSFIEQFQKQELLPSSTMSQIMQLFETDVCIALTKIYQANPSSLPDYLLFQFNNICVKSFSLDSSNIETQKLILSKGISGLAYFITELSQTVTQFEGILDFAAREIEMKRIYSTELAKAFILHGFELPISVLVYLLDLLQKGYATRSQDILDVFLYYFTILGFLLLLISFILLIRYTRQMNTTLHNVTFALTLIPYDRLMDDNAVSMLRNLRISQ